MSTHKLKDAKGATCGCEYTVNRAGSELITKMCQEHEIEFITRHAAAVASCSHVINHDLIS